MLKINERELRKRKEIQKMLQIIIKLWKEEKKIIKRTGKEDEEKKKENAPRDGWIPELNLLLKCS